MSKPKIITLTILFVVIALVGFTTGSYQASQEVNQDNISQATLTTKINSLSTELSQ